MSIDIWKPDTHAQTERERYLMWMCRRYQTMAYAAMTPWVAGVLILILWGMFG